MKTETDTFEASAAVLNNVTAQMSSIAGSIDRYRKLLSLEGICSTDDEHLCRLLEIGSRPAADDIEKHAAGLAKVLLSAQVALNGAYIYGFTDLYFDACLKKEPPAVKAIVAAYRSASMANHKPELIGGLQDRMEAELIRDWFLSDGALNDTQLALPEIEPPRKFRRLHNLRQWSHGKSIEVFPGVAGACGADGGGARGRVRIAVGGDRVDCGQDGLHR